MEVTLDPHLPALVADGTLLTLAGGNHLLVDTPFGRLPLGWRNVVFDLAARGITAVFAHPERCEQIMNDRTILTAMTEAGARLQTNYDSFAGLFGPDCTHLARWMAAEGLIHCLATDTHDLKKRHPGNAGRLRDELTQRVGSDNLRRLSLENPERALRGREMLAMDRDGLPRQDKRNWWQRWFSP